MGQGSLRSSLFLAAIAVALSLITGPLGAQANGEITGQVLDVQGQPFPGVTVTLLQAGKKETREQVSDAEGNIRFKSLDSGVYIATVAKEGYASVTCAGLRIVGQARKLQITLLPADGGQPSTCRPAG
jgi:Carboxypeptidase regulatory-like domain